MARATLAPLIAELRQLCEADIDSYKIGATYYWSDDQLQAVLDRHRVFYNHVPVAPDAQYTTGGVEYKIYRTNVTKWEGGTVSPGAYLQDISGATVPSANYTFDANTGTFTFTTDQAGAYYYVTGYAYDMNRAAAEVWRIKAAHAAVAYDVNTDNHGLKRSQLVTQALQMAQMYESMAGFGVVTLSRSDVATS